ncbi:hypothetical protein M1247_29290 [Mycobacterium sp. 21AC1]|uniref:DUF6611 family protein n=1 Tax=[Mycobacterium] appelbergii TaxID=2939269 RepID=UPI00293926B3|nr:DUF6611 family protein [Mycobacterium sp. 21AC1]MDV3129032.1 hypothetical protein [Mycobacterium sp. 21AC1]
MDTFRSRPGPLRRCWLRMLDGGRVWGSVDIRPGRFGITSYRLVVYPPGLDQTQRRWARAARGWPMWGLLLWLLCQAWLSGTMGPGPALGISVAVFVASGIAAVMLAGDARTQVRTMIAVTMAGYDDPDSRAGRDKLLDLAATLLEADDQLARGELSPVDHEVIWWRVYDQLQGAHPMPSRR